MQDTDGRKGSRNKPAGKQDTVGAVDDAPFRGYVNLQLSDDQKAAFESWSQSASLWDAFEASVSSGVNVSVKRERKQGGFLASATQRDPGSPNAGLVVTARGRDAVTAFGRVVFCLVLLDHKPRWEDTQPVANPDRW